MNRINRLFRELVGPAAVIAAGTMGAGAVASLILAGAWFRYDLLWVVLFMLPLFIIAVDSSGRIGSVNRGEDASVYCVATFILRWPGILLIINVPVHLLVAGSVLHHDFGVLSLFGMHHDRGAPQAQIDQYS
jgi:Mn2+/Fe2+ NRAMP family transporter